MKGWDLYVWSSGSETHFSLLMGTNRNKTAAEIFGPLPDKEAPADFVIANNRSFVELRSALSRLASGEWVHAEEVRKKGEDEYEQLALSAANAQSLRKIAADLGLQLNGTE